MIPTLALLATLLADPLDRVCQQPIYRDGGIVGMRVVDCPETESAECKPQCDQLRARGYGMIWPECRCNLFSEPWQIPMPVPWQAAAPDSCDLGEVLAAARAVEPLLHRSDEVPDDLHESVYVTGQAARLREVADRLDREDAAIARLRSALARCPEPQPGDDGDQKNPPQKNMRSRP